ncbi:hypothetical protein PoB_004958300 [Plakobranchus ocellatus]|uniref:Uncharacterized protein n=1 Tax=Plakobranchus ocellatus TaxID=259542 RepID=A0AAV4BTY9_9GAST|nr:hypothetical protein PoB_004958300 [Plakobranchus ocellatus]
MRWPHTLKKDHRASKIPALKWRGSSPSPASLYTALQRNANHNKRGDEKWTRVTPNKKSLLGKMCRKDVRRHIEKTTMSQRGTHKTWDNAQGWQRTTRRVDSRERSEEMVENAHTI